jgi:delta1-piperideine-2-carboxylate reductase
VVEDAAPGVVTVDARGGFAVPAFAQGRALLVAKARQQGVAALSVARSRHFSALWWEVEGLATDGLVAAAFVNTAAFVAHAPGGRERVYGTNPLAFGCPRGGGRAPLVFDQASAAMARGEVQLLLRAGLPLPPGVAVDSQGGPTTDPAAALAGAQLPAAAHKGSNLALMVELLAAGLSGSPYAGAATTALAVLNAAGAPPLPPGGTPTEHGELVLVLDPSRFGSLAGGGGEGGGEGNAGFAGRVEALLAAVLGSGDGVRLPGERRLEQRARTAARGGFVDVPADLLARVEACAPRTK